MQILTLSPWSVDLNTHPRSADHISSWFLLALVITALVTFVVFGCGPEPRFAFAIVSAVTMLIIACPSALGLAKPKRLMVAVRLCAAERCPGAGQMCAFATADCCIEPPRKRVEFVLVQLFDFVPTFGIG